MTDNNAPTPGQMTATQFASAVYGARIPEVDNLGRLVYAHWDRVAASVLVEARDNEVADNARAEGEAEGYARAVEEVAAFVDGRLDDLLYDGERPCPRFDPANIVELEGIPDAIRAKFGGK